VINIRFDKVNIFSSQDADSKGFFRIKAPVVPSVGETVGIRGNPYVVLERDWAFGDNYGTVNDRGYNFHVAEVYCYIRVLPAFTPPTKED
jgi:hypothetical protein